MSAKVSEENVEVPTRISPLKGLDTGFVFPCLAHDTWVETGLSTCREINVSIFSAV
jgi:hypothetical protein